MGSVTSLLAERVTFRLTSVDRVFVAGYVPGLQTEGQVVRFLLNRGYRIPSPAGLGHNHGRLIGEIERFIANRDLPVVTFARRERKEDVARPFLAGAEREGREGVVLVGKAQERVLGWRGFKDRADPRGQKGHPHFVYRRQALFVNHFYFYVWDRDWGPAFFKLCPYAPYPMWVWCNGHEWAKRQLAHAGVSFEPLDNGFRSVEDPDLAQRLCARLSADHLRRFLAKWTRRLPGPFVDDDAEVGCRYDWSVRQLEVSDTAVFDRPRSGRAWFEAPSATTSIWAGPRRWQSSSTGTSAGGASTPPLAGSPPRSSAPGSTPTSRSATGPRRPRRTSKITALCGWRPRSMTPMTSASDADCRPTTGESCATAAARSTPGFSPLSVTISPSRPMRPPWLRWSCPHTPLMASEPLACGSEIPGSWPCPPPSPRPRTPSTASPMPPSASA
jgi:hypothetical protein